MPVKILMFTNTYTPHVGGVARSVDAFTGEFRRRRHRTFVVAPTFDNLPEEETDVVRMPAIQNFNGSDFSFPVPAPGKLLLSLGDWTPDVVHAHHPFLLGDTALRVAATYDVPIIFTHHTLYDQYTHYLGGESPVLAKLAVDLATGYCNLCHGVIAPSESVREMLIEHGVETPIEVIPTGVDVKHFAKGDGGAFRQARKIPANALVVGHVGRLAPEKNLGFLSRAVAEYLTRNPQAYFLIVGSGPLADEIQQTFAEQGLAERLCMPGVLGGEELVNAYRAMDIFAFASQSETQGMVLTEAMAAGAPVVAVDGPGVRDVLVDKRNGRLLSEEDISQFAAALAWVADRQTTRPQAMSREVQRTARQFSLSRTASLALDFYQRVRAENRVARTIDDSAWAAAVRWLEQEWKILTHHAKAVGGAIAGAAGSSETPA